MPRTTRHKGARQGGAHGTDDLARHAEQLIGAGDVASRPELSVALGVSAATASAVVRRLIRDGVVVESGPGPSSGGRRPTLLSIRRLPGYVAVAELGARHARIGVCDGRGELLQAADLDITIEAGLEAVLDLLTHAWSGLVEVGGIDGPLLGVGLALPGPVDSARGEVISPARMPGWHGVRVTDVVPERLGVPVFVENDARAGALGEWVERGVSEGSLLYVKAGTGIGAAWVVDGVAYRGAAGIAGDVTHSRVRSDADLHCSCGNRGCLETVASGAAVRRTLAADGVVVAGLTELLALAVDSHPVVTTRLRSAGLMLGNALTPLVNFLNPHLVVLGGALSTVDAFVAGVRGELYDGCLPMCTQNLVIERSVSGPDAALLGLGHQVASHLDEQRRGSLRMAE